VNDHDPPLHHRRHRQPQAGDADHARAAGAATVTDLSRILDDGSRAGGSGASLFDVAAACLATCGAAEKAADTRAAAARWRAGDLHLAAAGPPAPIGAPGRPSRPLLVAPRELARRRLVSVEGRAALIHAVAHIEFNAINLAWDAVYRFRGLPPQYYADWVQVADEEAYHYSLLHARLRQLGYDYGDFPAHDGLWMMAEQTAHDVLVRMALVPRVLEARGLDVTPGMMERLSAAGDDETAALLAIILRDEIGHVAIGTHWFHHVCSERGLAPQQTFQRLIGEYLKGRIKGPFHHAARLQAGFSADELALLVELDQLPNDISDETSKHSNAGAATHKEKQRARDK